MKITIETIPHSEQRYPTVGDWNFDAEGNLAIKVSKMSDPRYEQLVAIHELVEALECQRAGVDQDAVTRFDTIYEASRSADDTDSEPGDDIHAPYYYQHQIATTVERVTAMSWDVDWNDYEAEIQSL